MADRHGPHARPGPAGSGPSRSRSTASTAGVRRNLFQSQLTRRPTPGSSNASAETLRLDAEQQQHQQAEDEDSGGIVVRDRNGEVELDDPPTPHVDDPDEVALDARQENERERQRLADAVKHHQINQNSVPAQPEEVLEAVRASLRAKVAALADDNWMYEKEDDVHSQ